MKTYKYDYPTPDGDKSDEYTEDEIIDRHWIWWSKQMNTIGSEPSKITKANCIYDWTIINFAYETEESLTKKAKYEQV